jgi:murein DD-endopeptidase MepM/ murein hydrolase activator NlpD
MKYQVVIVFFLFSTGCATTFQDRHSVKKGETKERVARRYQLSHKKLASLNEWADLSKFLPENVTVNISSPRGPIKANFTFRLKPEVRSSSGRGARYIWPVKGKLSSHYGSRWGTVHHGIDISAPRGTSIKAARGGKVIHSGYVSGYGNLVIVYHGRGYSTVYAHASKRLVQKGDRIKRGERIALVGSTGRSTGPHLHFEVRKYKEPVNPLTFLR